MNDLINIKVIQKDFNGEKKRFVNARELYNWLGVGRDFSNWIKDRIDKYEFTEDLDYFIAIAKFGDGLKPNKTGKIIDSKGEIENEFEKLKRILNKNEFVKKFNEFASQKNWKVYQKRARNIMATYDQELRNIKHPKLIDYKKEFSQEDIQKLIG